MDKILHYPLQGIYHNSHSLGSLGSCRILSINSNPYQVHFVLKVLYIGTPEGLAACRAERGEGSRVSSMAKAIGRAKGPFKV